MILDATAARGRGLVLSWAVVKCSVVGPDVGQVQQLVCLIYYTAHADSPVLLPQISLWELNLDEIAGCRNGLVIAELHVEQIS